MASSSSQMRGTDGESGGPAMRRTTSWVTDRKEDLNFSLPLYQAALIGDWQSAKNFIEINNYMLTASITPTSETALHVAVGTCKAIHFVRNLVDLMTEADLTLVVDINGDTALSVAAIVGNTKAARLLVEKNPYLPNTRNNNGLVPLHYAAQYGQKEMLLYLLSVTRDDPWDDTQPSPFADDSGVLVLVHVIAAGFYDIAIKLVKRYPKLATLRRVNGDSALGMLTKKPTAFHSGANLTSFWEHFIYSRLTVELESLENFRLDPIGEDIENAADSSQVPRQKCYNGWIFKAYQNWRRALSCTIEKLVPYIKHLRDMKLMHCQAYQLVECLCTEIKALHSSEAYLIFQEPLLSGAKFGIREIVEQIVQSFPFSVWIRDERGHNIFHLAVLYRRENIFNFIYEMNGHRHLFAQSVDDEGNNILHMAGMLPPEDRLNILSGAALQVQRELQWYKEVEKFVLPTYKGMFNRDGRTPAEIFATRHKELVQAGERWIKKTANSCTIAAVLIATVVFAAAITVPGGYNNGTGLPFFSKDKVFTLFAISDALSLFTSMASLLMFFSILTSRYADADFLYDLPKKLIIDLVSLFLSISLMMIAFSATMYLVFGNGSTWILHTVIIASSLPVTIFASLQFPILVDMIKSTYGPGIFGKRSRQLLY